MPNKAGRGRCFFRRTLSRATVISERKIKKKVSKNEKINIIYLMRQKELCSKNGEK